MAAKPFQTVGGASDIVNDAVTGLMIGVAQGLARRGYMQQMSRAREANAEAVDPVRTLAEGLLTSGKPPLHWVMKYSEGGVDPVQFTYDRSDDSNAMLTILLAHEDGRDVILELVLAHPDQFLRWSTLYGFTGLYGIADKVRNLVPVPPTLKELLEYPWIKG